MEYMHKIKKMLCKELEEYGDKKSLSSADVEMIHKLTDTVKNLDKISLLEESNDGYSETYPYYMGGSSYARGRGRNARRDSMGRYSSDMGDDYSERMDRRYSRDDAKDHMMNKLGMMMEDADPKEREALKECMRAIERA
jgi:hypothetical protein